MRHVKLQRLFALLLVLSLALSLLAGCGNRQTEPEEAVTPQVQDPAPVTPAQPDPAPVTPAQPVPAVEPTPVTEPAPAEPEPDPDLFVAEGNVNPLTGLCDGISDEALERRPIAVMINNIKTALPQWGISKADIIYEMLAEGRITRLLAIFQDYSKIEKLASIRSARPYYMDIAQSYGAVYIHFGGSVPAYNAIAARSDLIHIDGIKGNWEGTVFFRDPTRRAQMGLEHSVYTTGEYLQTAMDKLAGQGKDLSQSDHPSAFRFDEHMSVNSAMDGEQANKVTITFSSSHKPYFEYDEETGKYLRFEYGSRQMDGWHDVQIATENVLVLRMATRDVPNSDLHLIEITTTGTGDGFYFCGGKYVPITWKKDKYNSEIRYYTLDGEELTVARGQTFVSCITTTADVVIE